MRSTISSRTSCSDVELDGRGLTREQLATDERLSLHRGLLAVRLPVPLWIIQTAGQEVERWGLPGDHPIFTEHAEDQFSWMIEGYLPREESFARFAEDSGLVFSPARRRVIAHEQE